MMGMTETRGMFTTERKLRATGITGLGVYLPERILTNAEIVASGLDTSEEWIYEKIGIRERRIAAMMRSYAGAST